MNAYTIKLFSIENDQFMGEESINAKTESAALGKARKALKDAGVDISEYRFEIEESKSEEVKEEVKLETKVEEVKEETPVRVIHLDPANSPLGVGEKPRQYPSSIKTELGTFWGCDQQKLLGTIKLNTHALDGYRMTTSGSRTNFWLDHTLIWSTTKPIAILADEMAQALIKTLAA